MPDYYKSKIYCLRLIDTEQMIYIGSTTQHLYQRLSHHKSTAKTHPQRPIYAFINLLPNKFDDVKIELIEYCPCDNVEELHRCEGGWIRRYKSEINNVGIPGRTPQEYNLQYKQEHVEDIREKKKQYYQDHVEDIHKQQKEYRQENRDKINKKQNEKYAQKKAQHQSTSAQNPQ